MKSGPGKLTLIEKVNIYPVNQKKADYSKDAEALENAKLSHKKTERNSIFKKHLEIREKLLKK